MAQDRKKTDKQSSPEFARLIRSIQRIEGTTDCFGKTIKNCKHRDCDWLEYCVKETRKVQETKEMNVHKQ